MARSSLRESLIEAGVCVLHERGFTASGVRDITEAAGAPLGSFTNHFSSKEAFGLAVLDRYFERLTAVMDANLRDERLKPLNRIDAYFTAIDQIARPLEWGHGCMVANLGLEMASLSEALRHRLIDILQSLTEPFATALRAGQRSGDVRADYDSEDLALLVLSGWHGALLRAKVERSGDALERYWRTLRGLLGLSSANGTGATSG